MRIFYGFIMIWCLSMFFSLFTSAHVGLFGPLLFIIILLLFFWALKKFRQEGRRQRERRQAWRRDPNNWSI